jgi:hypothetical protein
MFAYFNYPKFDAEGNETGIDDISAHPEFISMGERDALSGSLSSTNHLDLEALVFTPFGGGRNFGLLYLPQVNTKGVVTFLDADHHKPMWIGSYFEAKHNRTDYDTIEYINAPGDNKLKDGKDMDAYAGGGTNFNGDITDSLVLRTKHTIMDRSDGTKMDFQAETSNTENLIIINQDEVSIRHFSKWNGEDAKFYQDINIKTNTGEDATITLTAVDVDGGKITSATLASDNILLTADDGSDPKITLKLAAPHGITFIDDSDNLVTYKDLKIIVEKIEVHKHVRFPSGGSDGMTGEPVIGQGTPFKADITSPKKDMKADLLFAKS